MIVNINKIIYTIELENQLKSLVKFLSNQKFKCGIKMQIISNPCVKTFYKKMC